MSIAESLAPKLKPTPAPRPSFGSRVAGLFSSITARQHEQEQASAATYAELVDQLVSLEVSGDGKAPTPAAVDAILRAAGRNVQDLESDVSRGKRIAELRSVVASRDQAEENRDSLRDAIRAEEAEFEQLRAAHLHKLEGLHQHLRTAEAEVSRITTAGNELVQLTAAAVDEQLIARRRELAREIAQQKAITGIHEPERFQAFEETEDGRKLAELDRRVEKLRSMDDANDGFSANAKELRRVLEERDALAQNALKVQNRCEAAAKIRDLQAQLAELQQAG